MRQWAITTAVACSILIGVVQGRAQAQVANLTFAQGVVEHLPAGQARYLSSNVGLSLGEGFRVRTGKRSKAEIRFANRNVITLAQLSECIIHNNRDVDHTKGKMRGEFATPARVRSGSAVANIQGTTLVFELVENPDGTVTGFISYVAVDPTRPADQQNVEIITPEGRARLQPGRRIEFRAIRARLERQIEEDVNAAPNTPLPTARFRLRNAVPDRFVAELIDRNLTSDNVEGGQIQNVVGTDAQRNFRLDPLLRQQNTDINNFTQREAFNLARNVLQVQIPPQPPQDGGTGGIGVIVTSPVGPRHPRWTTGRIKRAATSASPEGLAPSRLAPRFDGSLFIFKGEGRDRSFSVFLSERGVIDKVYWEVAVAPSNFFDPNTGNNESDLDVTDASLTFRGRQWGEIVVGRQRFLKGPVQNTITGTLIRQGGRDIQDAVTFSPKFKDKRLNVDLSYILDAFPAGLPTAVSGTQPGVYGRVQYQTNFGTYGVNVHGNSISPKTGVTGDFSIPVIKNQVDFYGEIGRDTFSRDVRTVGVYFPGLFQKSNVDVFLERTNLKDFGMTNEWLLRIYPRFGDRYSGLIAIDKASGGDTRIGVGVAIGLSRKR